MALHPIACGLDDDDVLVISGATLTSTKWSWSLELSHILVAVHFVSPEALPAQDASPFRAAAVPQIAVAVDAFGALHAVDAKAGTLLFSLPAVGAPVDVAASERQIAIATRERIVTWIAGKRTETRVVARAIAFGAKLAFATEQGVFVDDKAITVAASPGRVVDLAQRPNGEWLVGSTDGLFGKDGRLLDGEVRRVAVDHKCIVVQRSDTMIAVYNLPHVTPAKRLHYSDRTIIGFALAAGELVVAFDGGRSERINLLNGQSKYGTVEDVRAKSEAYLSGRIGNRRGVVAILPVACAAGLCLWTYLHPHTPALPPPHFGPLPKLALPVCDAACEVDRIGAVIAACAPDVECLHAAKQIKVGFGFRQCTSVHLQLDALAEQTKRPAVVGAVKNAQAGLATACLEPAPPRYQVLGFRSGVTLSVPPPQNLGEVVAFSVDETSHVYIAASLPHERCDIYRRGNVDAQWTTILTVSGCVEADIAAKQLDDVYFTTTSGVMHYDGATWAPTRLLATDVMNAFAPHDDTKWASPDGQVFRANAGAMWRSQDHGSTWTRDDIGPVKFLAGRAAADVFAAGSGGLFHFDGKQWRRTLDAPVDWLATNASETWVMIQTK